MSLQDILQKILDEAKQEVEDIKKKLEQEKKVLLEESNKIEIENTTSLTKKKAETIEKIKQKIDSMARREVRQKMLTIRHEIIIKAMDSFAKHLENLSDEKYGKILKKLFTDISEKEGLILAPKNKLEVTKKFTPAGFTIQSSDLVKAGFIAKLGKAEIDNTFHNLVFSEFNNQIRGFFAEKLNLI